MKTVRYDAGTRQRHTIPVVACGVRGGGDVVRGAAGVDNGDGGAGHCSNPVLADFRDD